MRRRNLREQRRLLKLLESFYRQHSADIAVRLILAPFGFGAFQITNQGAETQKILPRQMRKRALAEFQREFQAFADFLKSEAFAS